MYLKRGEEAHREFQSVLRIDPKNERVHYWIGRAYQKQKLPDKAKTSFETYLSFSNTEPFQRGAAHYRLGLIARRAKAYAQAEAHFKEGMKLGHKGSKRALARLRQKRRDGIIEY